MLSTGTALPSVTDQARRLLSLGLATTEQLAGIGPAAPQGALVALHPRIAPASTLATAITYDGKPGFVVTDMTDVDEFTPIASAAPPDADVYILDRPDRGDTMANWSPDEALPAILADGRSPMTLTEGLHWLLQCPAILERGRCFMTIGSRKPKPNGTFDTRTPALWISNGTGRDGTDRRGAAKVGWCWAGNRHTWLGFASAGSRTGLGE